MSTKKSPQVPSPTLKSAYVSSSAGVRGRHSRTQLIIALMGLGSPITHFIFLPATVYFTKLCKRLSVDVRVIKARRMRTGGSITEPRHPNMKKEIRKRSRKGGRSVDGRTMSK
ncbi:hypothetical protein L798_12373 [Zootermopsis nevadensis]|uniref:Uncharacterized protein n=1 Tax=Zootermopsis nevadensis TaxID=136037 RepID=A0A067RI72_ZOONE|nr:hypothetical protein L798_12373 [Zootermopsis nevadensis]